MQIALAGLIVLALVAIFAGPALAARLNGARVAQPVVVAQLIKGDELKTDKLDKTIKLDAFIKGELKLDLVGSKVADKWKISELKCDDVTVVATNERGIVASTKATAALGDPASCIYSMKVPSGEPLSVYAELGSAKSVGITGFHKLPNGSYAKEAIKSDLKTEKFLKIDTFKTELAQVKLKNGETETLKFDLKLDKFELP